jgi:hypothetical protein
VEDCLLHNPKQSKSMVCFEKNLKIGSKAFKAMGAGPPLDLTANSSKPLTGAIVRKATVLNE